MNQKEYLTVIDEHQAIIHKICHLYRDRKEDREDLFQEIIFQIWRSFPGFKGAAKVSTWIYRIALNTAMATFRKKQPVIDYPPTLPDYAEEIQNEEVAIRKEKLFFALQQLDDSEKAIITLYLEDLNYRQIAEVTGINENYVGVRLNRVRHKIQKILNKK